MIVRNKSGQVLLIAVMMLATVITVVMTIAFNTTSETQVARLEADSQKALAAAEAGIDAVIKQSINTAEGTVNIQDISQGQFGDQGIKGSAKVVGVSQNYFVTPLLQKDEQYTLYLSQYPGFGSPWSGSLTIHLVSEANPPCPSLEVTVVLSDNTLERYAYNTCDASVITGAPTASHPAAPTKIDTSTFEWKIPSPITVVNGKVAFMKVLGVSGVTTKIGIESDAALPFQGKTVESEARTASGVVKKVQLFQSFPQIPSNFFMTSF